LNSLNNPFHQFFWSRINTFSFTSKSNQN
jgi:hypothetical protein